jgi:5-methylcytosine-specific restriction protein A
MFHFKIYHEYERTDLLQFVGSKQNQSGIIWGNKNLESIIITSGGKHGKGAGYSDIKHEDGSWTYIGQGSTGNQNPKSFANSLLTNRQRTILLFSTREPTAKQVKLKGNRNKQYKFEGLFDVLSWTLERDTEGKRKGDKLLLFRLVPVDNIFDSFEISSSLIRSANEDFEALYHKSLQNKPLDSLRVSYSEYKQRSQVIKRYALLRSGGKCELCLNDAPFITTNNYYFLEVHHIHKLADDGPDLPINVAALCPNCHREAHFGKDHLDIKRKLILHIELKEAGIH